VCMTSDITHPVPNPERLGTLTRRYARYSRTAGGLGSVLGGVLVLVTYFVGALALPKSVEGRLALASAPLIWIAGKELLRTRFYQQLGRVQESMTPSERRWHLGFTLFTAIVSVAVIAFLLVSARDDLARLATPGRLGYLAFVAAMPLLAWRFMRTPLEFIIGIFLVAQAAVVLAGGHYALGEQPQAPIVAVVLIVVGIRQHMEFHSL